MLTFTVTVSPAAMTNGFAGVMLDHKLLTDVLATQKFDTSLKFQESYFQ